MQSVYYWVLLFPVISTAAALGVVSTLAFTGVACAAYLSFLLPVRLSTYKQHRHLEADQTIAELARRVLFLAHFRECWSTFWRRRCEDQSQQYQILAEELAATNKNLAARRRLRRAGRSASPLSDSSLPDLRI